MSCRSICECDHVSVSHSPPLPSVSVVVVSTKSDHNSSSSSSLCLDYLISFLSHHFVFSSLCCLSRVISFTNESFSCFSNCWQFGFVLSQTFPSGFRMGCGRGRNRMRVVQACAITSRGCNVPFGPFRPNLPSEGIVIWALKLNFAF